MTFDFKREKLYGSVATGRFLIDMDYDSLVAPLVEAVKEQQKIIESQQKQIDELKKIVCKKNLRARICVR